MRKFDILHKYVGEVLAKAGIRKTKIKALIDMTDSLLDGSQLTLTGLGRNLNGQSYVKHKIKRVDRWLSNIGLYNEQVTIYKALFSRLLESRHELDIIIDWTGCCNWYESCIRASLVFDGRSVVIYQEVHKTSEHQKPHVHQEFLNNLYSIIPADSKVNIITDRGFQLRWFQMTQAMGWNFIGRVSISNHYCLENEEIWQSIKALYLKATNRPAYLGKALLGKSKRLRLKVSIFAYKGKNKYRKPKKSKNRHIYNHLNKSYSDMHKTPLIVVTSLSLGGKTTANAIIKKYQRRMQIEQNFRDDKNERWGFSFQFGRSRTAKRISILLLIACICSFILMMIGIAAEKNNLHKSFQANTIKHRRVLSFLSLAKQVIRHCYEKIKPSWLTTGFNEMAEGVRLYVI